jgi:hypothetical protein
MRLSQNTLNTKQPAKVLNRDGDNPGCTLNEKHQNHPLLPIFQVRLLSTKHIKLIAKARAMIALVVALFYWVVTSYSI